MANIIIGVVKKVDPVFGTEIKSFCSNLRIWIFRVCIFGKYWRQHFCNFFFGNHSCLFWLFYMFPSDRPFFLCTCLGSTIRPVDRYNEAAVLCTQPATDPAAFWQLCGDLNYWFSHECKINVQWSQTKIQNYCFRRLRMWASDNVKTANSNRPKLLFPTAVPRIPIIAGSADHEKKRKIAIKCLELEEMLESKGWAI